MDERRQSPSPSGRGERLGFQNQLGPRRRVQRFVMLLSVSIALPFARPFIFMTVRSAATKVADTIIAPHSVALFSGVDLEHVLWRSRMIVPRCPEDL